MIKALKLGERKYSAVKLRSPHGYSEVAVIRRLKFWIEIAHLKTKSSVDYVLISVFFTITSRKKQQYQTV